MRRLIPLLAIAVAMLMPASAAFAASGSLNDPDDDTIADVLKLSYANKDAKVVMRMTYDGDRPQVENFYVKWGTDGKYYKLQRSPNGTTLWFNNGASESEKSCSSDNLSHNSDTFVSTGVIPRSCMSRAPDKVKFQGFVTEGLFDSDQTKTSAGVARG